eukprot:gene8051-9905_t
MNDGITSPATTTTTTNNNVEFDNNNNNNATSSPSLSANRNWRIANNNSTTKKFESSPIVSTTNPTPPPTPPITSSTTPSSTNNNEIDFYNDGSVPAKSVIINILNKFLKGRPTKEDLVQNRVLKSDYKPIPLRYSIIDILCSHLEKHALEMEGIFRVSGSAQQIRLFWSTFNSDQIEFPPHMNEHTVAGSLKLYIRENPESLIPYEAFQQYISTIQDDFNLSDFSLMISKVSPDSLKIIKRIIRLLVIICRHSKINKMNPTNMGIVFGPNFFKPKDPANVINETKYYNESVTHIILNHSTLFPDLIIPLTGTETNSEDWTEDENNNNSSIPNSANSTPAVNSPGTATTNQPSTNNLSSNPPSPLILSSSISTSASTGSSNNLLSSGSSTPANSITNSKSTSKAQLQPIHPSLADATQHIPQKSTPLSQMKRKDFSMANHLANRLKKTKHFRNQERWDHFLVLKVNGNLVGAQKTSTSGESSGPSLTSSRDKNTKKKQNSTLSASAATNITFVPMYIFVSSENIFIFDTATFEIQTIIPHSRLKEISIDTVNRGLFSLLDAESHKLHFFLVPKLKVIDYLVTSLEKGRAIVKLKNKSLPHLQARKFPLLEGNSNGGFGKLPESRPVFESLAANGFSELDVWEGTVDLLEVVKKFQNILIPIENKAVVEFLLPNIEEFKGIYRKSYKLYIGTSVYKIICLICEKVKLEPSKFVLRTLKGRTLYDNLSLSAYGLGTLFTTWQLRLIALDSPDSTGNFVVEFYMPDSPEFKGMQKKAIKVDAYQPLKRIMKGLCEKLKIPKYHYYYLIGPEGEVLGDNDVLSSIGLGIKFKTCKMKLMKKVFPIGKGPEIDTPIVKSLLNDIVDSVYKKVKERQQERIRVYCKHLLEYVVDQTLLEISKSETIPKRVAMLGRNSRAEFYNVLATKEEEELVFMNLDGYKRTLINARTIVDVDDPEPSSMYPLYKPRSMIPSYNPFKSTNGLPTLRDIKISNSKNHFLSEMKEGRKLLHGISTSPNNNGGVGGGNVSSLKNQTTKKFIRPPINNPNSIVSLLSLRPGTSKLVEQLKKTMSANAPKLVDINQVEDLIPLGSPVQTRRNNFN